MRGIRLTIILILLVGLSSLVARAQGHVETEPDDLMAMPLRSLFELAHWLSPVEQALGFYSSGQLRLAQSLTPAEPGLLKLFIPRNRGYATNDLLTLIRDSGIWNATTYPDGERLQIGDVAQESGGLISGHASHQNGLDADIVYLRMNHIEQDPSHIDGFEELFVKEAKLTPNFDLKRNWALLTFIVEHAHVGRIFVDPAIKKALCIYSGQSDSVAMLRRLRPLSGHDDHFHVRLECPEGSLHCVHQEPPPEGSGCNEVL